jgi:hypothetical protein
MGCKGGRQVGLTKLPSLCGDIFKYGSLNLLEHSGPHKPSIGIALPLPLPLEYFIKVKVNVLPITGHEGPEGE